MAEAARACALLAGRPTVGFEDVAAIAAPVLNHRLILNYKARLDQFDSFTLVRQLLDGLNATGLDLPADVSIAEVRHA
jgi:MoxR-like ATPase